eukprot:1038150-Pelagomonas_calceolata.AAC.1
MEETKKYVGKGKAEETLPTLIKEKDTHWLKRAGEFLLSTYKIKEKDPTLEGGVIGWGCTAISRTLLPALHNLCTAARKLVYRRDCLALREHTGHFKDSLRSAD